MQVFFCKIQNKYSKLNQNQNYVSECNIILIEQINNFEESELNK